MNIIIPLQRIPIKIQNFIDNNNIVYKLYKFYLTNLFSLMDIFLLKNVKNNEQRHHSEMKHDDQSSRK